MKTSHIIATLFFCFSNTAVGQTFTETSDTGATIPTATTLPVGTTQVNGEILDDPDTDVDLYRFQPQSSGPFTLSVDGEGSSYSMIVFNAAGQGLAGDDENTAACDTSLVPALANFDPCLTLNLTGGADYFVAVGAYRFAASVNNTALNSKTFFIGTYSGVLAMPTTEILGVMGRDTRTGQFGDEGDYQLHLVSSTPPPVTPSTPANIPATPLYIMFSMAISFVLLACKASASRILR